MDRDKLIRDTHLNLEDERFYRAIFRQMAVEKKAPSQPEDPFVEVISEGYDLLSEKLDGSKIQESCSVRNILRARHLAKLLINEEGELNRGSISSAIAQLQRFQYSLGPNRQYDAKRNQQMIAVLTKLHKDHHLVKALLSISRPHNHRIAEQLIRQTLELSSEVVITDAHARRAALSAWLCYLRQSVGSCFATAPAIIIHDEQPEQFLVDLQELLGTGRLKRIFGGVEYTVPLSRSWGAGDLGRLQLIATGPLSRSAGIWSSPGLVRALESADVIDKTLSVEEKEEQLRDLALAALPLERAKQPFLFLSAAKILQAVLLKHFSLTEDQVEEHLLRPREMFQSRLIMMPQASLGEAGRRCEQFLEALDQAKNSFKALADNALLKAWEFTMASFSETKTQFARWNLYSSLGLSPNENGGIGERLYAILQQKIDECNREVAKYQEEYEIIHQQLLYLQRRVRSASSEQEAKWMRMEYQTKESEFHLFEEMRNKVHYQAQRLANLYNELMEIYEELFPRYFQEVYDAEMHVEGIAFYDDSPAGFRLLYKYGIRNTAQWTLIYTPAEFVESLVSFFTATEAELAGKPEMEGLQITLSEIMTAVVTHVRSEEFLETAFHRMAVAHRTQPIRDPLKNLDKIEKKPWAYTSGGAMNTLVSCYFRREQKPTEVSRWMENPIELLVYLVDVLKEIPPRLMEEYIDNPEHSMLIHSPTHAFLLKPGYPALRRAWQSDFFTYTWLRDSYVSPRQAMVDRLFLHEEMMQFIVEALAKKVPEQFRHYFLHSFDHMQGSMSVQFFRDYLLENIEMSPGLKWHGGPIIGQTEIDSTLFSLLPLFPSYQLQERIRVILNQLPGLDQNEKEQILHLTEEHVGKAGAPKLISAKGLQEIMKALIFLVKGEALSPHDYHLYLSRIAQKEGYAFPEPIIFADTNWVRDLFAFVVNPGSGKLELWRVDYTGMEGAPMADWKKWLDGSRKDPTWGIYTRPYEYRAPPMREFGRLR